MRNVKTDRYGIRTFVKVGGLPQKEQRWKPGTPHKTLQDWIDKTRVELRQEWKDQGGATAARAGETFNEDVYRYLQRVKPVLAKETYASRVCELDAYRDAFHGEPRSAITRDRVLELRRLWLTEGKGKRTGSKISPKTVQNREAALRHLFHVMDGKRAPTPIDDLPPLPKYKPAPRFVSVQRIRLVAKRLTHPFYKGVFMVLASTGQRPAQLKRSFRGDVKLRRGIWNVRPAKGGHPIPLWLTKDMIAAFKVLIAAGGYDTKTGQLRHFDGSDYAKAVYAAGWPKDIRPYNAKHTVALTLAETGAEWDDIKDHFGQTDLKTTRIYTGLVEARMKGTSKRLEGRIGW